MRSPGLLRKRLEQIAGNNEWQMGGAEIISGGSTVEANTHRVRCLRNFIKAHRIRNVIDVPCGDANWQLTLMTS